MNTERGVSVVTLRANDVLESAADSYTKGYERNIAHFSIPVNADPGGVHQAFCAGARWATNRELAPDERIVTRMELYNGIFHGLCSSVKRRDKRFTLKACKLALEAVEYFFGQSKKKTGGLASGESNSMLTLRNALEVELIQNI
jgi:hypothetical protein